MLTIVLISAAAVTVALWLFRRRPSEPRELSELSELHDGLDALGRIDDRHR